MGRNDVKTVFTLEGNKLIEKQEYESKTSTITYEFGEKEMISTLEAEGVISTRKYRVQ